MRLRCRTNTYEHNGGIKSFNGRISTHTININRFCRCIVTSRVAYIKSMVSVSGQAPLRAGKLEDSIMLFCFLLFGFFAVMAIVSPGSKQNAS